MDQQQSENTIRDFLDLFIGAIRSGEAQVIQEYEQNSQGSACYTGEYTSCWRGYRLSVREKSVVLAGVELHFLVDDQSFYSAIVHGYRKQEQRRRQNEEELAERQRKIDLMQKRQNDQAALECLVERIARTLTSKST